MNRKLANVGVLMMAVALVVTLIRQWPGTLNQALDYVVGYLEVVSAITGVVLFLGGVVLTLRSVDRELEALNGRVFAVNVDVNASSEEEYHKAIETATNRIWICQTWFPGHAKDANQIMKAHSPKRKILLASFKKNSHIWARIQGRADVVEKPEDAMRYVRGCVAALRDNDETVPLKFNYGHHPGWIAIIDDDVFWGPTPVNVDNQSRNLFFHKATIESEWGQFWKGQFELLWSKYSHEYDEEKNYNTTMKATDESPSKAIVGADSGRQDTTPPIESSDFERGVGE